MNNIPEKINAFNVYLSGNMLIGLSEEVALPSFEGITETVSGPGLLGEFESAALGHFSSMEMEIPFRQMDEEIFKLADQSAALDLTLRGSIQFTEGSTGATGFKPMRVVVRGKNKSLEGGSAKQGNGTKSKIKVEILYILIEVSNKPMVELDKLNFVFKVNGKDLMEKVRRMC